MKRKLLSLSLALLLAMGVLLIPASAARLSDATTQFASDAMLIKSGYLGQTVSFREKDFKQALGTSKLTAITIVSLPDARQGSLLLSSSRIGTGDSIPASALDLLKFVPADKTVEESSFIFTAGNVAGGAEIKCQIRLVDKKNVAPTAAGGALSVLTQTDISYFGNLVAEDADGDSLYFRVTVYPEHGTLTLLDRETGSFRYTPNEGFAGKDSFSYVVRDEYGHFSTESDISVSVKKRSSSLVYEDLAGTKDELAAIALSDAGVMLGRLSGDGMYFDADGTVSRGEFTAMAMKVAGVIPSLGVFDTCFDDNEEIPASVRPYIATAQKMGVVRGSFNGDGLYFEADRAVTAAEASVIICNLMGVTADESAAVLASGGDIPVWARAEVGTLHAMGALDTPTSNAPLTRAEIAKLLYTFLEK
ncbi:MAG: hypothetical protein E7609_07805 [Ruminococcaceae bacterium]|nr:hypothetical protein [Oscillospiraceae bacterium]